MLAKIRKAVFLCIIFMSFLMHSVLDINANGAASFPGYSGGNITIAESRPFEEFIVDEEVEIDINKQRISVVYDINNTSSEKKSFNMLFPIESRVCALKEKGSFGDEPWEVLIAFKAKLNDIALPVKSIELATIKLEGEYSKLYANLCSIISFPVIIKQGQNQLKIEYNVAPAHVDGGGLGAFWSLWYPIWPAKNWVSKFRKAQWRVIIPDLNLMEKGIGYYKFQFDDWYAQFEGYSTAENGKEVNGIYWRKKSWSVQGPGIREDYKTYVSFIATDYKPAGQVTVGFAMEDLSHIVDNDCNKPGSQEVSIISCMESFFKIHPYVGDKRCYFAADLVNMPDSEMEFRFAPEALPFFRNEIFARKGYVFTSEPMRKFFAKMPWYQPKSKEVKLTEIENWNVEFIKEIEKKVQSIQDYDNDPYILNKIHREMRKKISKKYFE